MSCPYGKARVKAFCRKTKPKKLRSSRIKRLEKKLGAPKTIRAAKKKTNAKNRYERSVARSKPVSKGDQALIQAALKRMGAA